MTQEWVQPSKSDGFYSTFAGCLRPVPRQSPVDTNLLETACLAQRERAFKSHKMLCSDLKGMVCMWSTIALYIPEAV